jgi:C-terminal processing protease CtpA/Prc
VVAVKPESPAEEGGLKPGDVIAQVNKQAVHGAPEAQKLLSSAGASVLLRVLREGRGVFIVMTHAAG